MPTERSSDRLIFFSDSVMAVAVTLLVLDVRLPVEAAGLGERELQSAILETLPRIYAYVLSFVVVGVFWTSHHQKFGHIPRIDGPLNWLNVLFLLIIGLVPFVTAVLSQSDTSTATILYAVAMAALGAVLTAIWVYARWRGLLSEAATPTRWWTMFWVSAGTSLVFALSIPVAFLNPNAGKYFWLLLVPVSLWNAATSRRKGSSAEFA
jgi:uncharacterized membrane protein